MTDYEDRYRCSVCKRWWVVPSLAADCFARHDRETEPDE